LKVIFWETHKHTPGHVLCLDL